MVYKIVGHRYGIFIESVVIAIIILIIGFSLGYYIESFRTKQIVEAYKNYDVEAFDLKLQNYYFQMMDKSACKAAIEHYFNFADRVYEKGLVLEKYEQANQITNDIILEKKKYVLLKLELWLDSITLKKMCGNPFNTLVYFYSHDPSNTQEVAQQKIISNVLKDLKDEHKNEVVLLPIAGDMGLISVDMQLQVYNITSLPAILIDEKKVLYGFNSKEEIEMYLK